jgi:hypothetical protein
MPFLVIVGNNQWRAIFKTSFPVLERAHKCLGYSEHNAKPFTIRWICGGCVQYNLVLESTVCGQRENHKAVMGHRDFELTTLAGALWFDNKLSRIFFAEFRVLITRKDCDTRSIL